MASWIRKLLIGVMVLLFLLLIGLLIGIFSTKPVVTEPRKMNLGEIEAYLGANVPEDASDITFDSDRGNYDLFIDLSFKSSPESASQFASSICDGVLHEGYDPFNAINTSQIPPQQVYLIKMQTWTHYSYSPDASQSVWGNRCWPFGEGVHQIRLDRTNPVLYEVRFETPGQARWDCEVIPCRPFGQNYIEPIVEIPLVVIGMGADSNDAFVLVTNEVCVETLLDYILGGGITANDRWAYLIGANIQVLIDDEPLEPAYISEYGTFRQSQHELDTHYFDYCFTRDWQPGIHSMTLNLTTTEAESYTYTWQFRVE
jgi:hypothetical protein